MENPPGMMGQIAQVFMECGRMHFCDVPLMENQCWFDPSTSILVQACLHSEGHMDDGLTLQRCQHEESRAARIIRNTTRLFNHFIR